VRPALPFRAWYRPIALYALIALFSMTPSEFTKIYHFKITKQKIFWGGDLLPTPFGTSSPNLKLALTPLLDYFSFHSYDQLIASQLKSESSLNKNLSLIHGKSEYQSLSSVMPVSYKLAKTVI